MKETLHVEAFGREGEAQQPVRAHSQSALRLESLSLFKLGSLPYVIKILQMSKDMSNFYIIDNKHSSSKSKQIIIILSIIILIAFLSDRF